MNQADRVGRGGRERISWVSATSFSFSHERMKKKKARFFGFSFFYYFVIGKTKKKKANERKFSTFLDEFAQKEACDEAKEMNP